MSKPRIALYWCASCGGCEEAIVDFGEDILALVESVELAFWPVALDFKKADVTALPDGALFATLLNGAIRTDEQEEMARLLRRKSRHLVAYGACACSGGIPGLANQFSREQILRFVYGEAVTLAPDDRSRPQLEWKQNGDTFELPMLHEVVRPLNQVVPVDYYIPGCPPTPAITQAALRALLSDTPPPRGSVLAPDVALCEECARKASKPTDLSFTAFKRPHEVVLDSAKCLLAQGVPCCGPATRAGCGALCINGNMPCSGCCGPTSRVRDQGAKLLSSLCANLAAREVPAITQALEGIPDPVGTFYRYTLPQSLLRSSAHAAEQPSKPATR